MKKRRANLHAAESRYEGVYKVLEVRGPTVRLLNTAGSGLLLVDINRVKKLTSLKYADLTPSNNIQHAPTIALSADIHLSDEDIEWEVVAVLDHRGSPPALQYKLDWAGVSTPTWNDASDCACSELIREYWEKLIQLN